MASAVTDHFSNLGPTDHRLIPCSPRALSDPQVNTNFKADQSGYNGNVNHWLVRNPTGWAVTYHELGHAQLMSMYRGETEALCNFVYTYVRHVKFNDSFAVAFNNGMSHSNYDPDGAAVHWMITPNFRAGNEMDRTNSEYNEFRYQHRGYAKYADIVRLFGWDTFTGFYHQEHLDYEAGLFGSRWDVRADDGLPQTDSRTLRLSVQAGCDLTPLIEVVSSK